MELHFRRHRHSESEPARPAPFAYAYGGRDTRDEPNPNNVASEDPDDLVESDSADDSNGGQPESSGRGAPNSPYASNLQYGPYFPYSERWYQGPAMATR